MRWFKQRARSDDGSYHHLRSQMLKMSGLSDLAFDSMLADCLPPILDNADLEQLQAALTSVLADEFFYRESRKASFVIAVNLITSELLAVKKMNNAQPSMKWQHVEIVTVAEFYSLITNTCEGYSWLNKYPALLREAWQFLKGRRGRFERHLRLLHVEAGAQAGDLGEGLSTSEITEAAPEDDDLDFSRETEGEISSLFQDSFEAESHGDVLAQLAEEQEPQVAQAPSNNSDNSNDDCLDIAGLIN